MEKKILSFIRYLGCCCLMFTGLSFSVFAYDIPDNSYHMQLVTEEIGQITVAIPYNQAKYISWDGENFTNQYSSAITGYANTLTAGSSTEYQIRFPIFGGIEYRTSNSSYSYADLTVTAIVYNNLPNINDSDFTVFSQQSLTNMIICLIGGSIMVLLLKRR